MITFGDRYIDFVTVMGTKGGQLIPLGNAALGLCDEVAEAFDATLTCFSFHDEQHGAFDCQMRDDALLELGDVCWYIAALCAIKGIDALTLARHSSPTMARFNGWRPVVDRLVIQAGLVGGMAKKEAWHDRVVAPVLYARHLGYLLDLVDTLASYMGSSTEEVVEMNVQKLKARWPSGFGVAQ